jgi:hypothetical protein
VAMGVLSAKFWDFGGPSSLVLAVSQILNRNHESLNHDGNHSTKKRMQFFQNCEPAKVTAFFLRWTASNLCSCLFRYPFRF